MGPLAHREGGPTDNAGMSWPKEFFYHTPFILLLAHTSDRQKRFLQLWPFGFFLSYSSFYNFYFDSEISGARPRDQSTVTSHPWPGRIIPYSQTVTGGEWGFPSYSIVCKVIAVTVEKTIECTSSSSSSYSFFFFFFFFLCLDNWRLWREADACVLCVGRARPNSRDTLSAIRPSIPGIIAHQVPHTRTCEIRGKKEWNIHKPVLLFSYSLRSVSSTILSLNFGPIHIRCLVWILLRFCYARPPMVHSRAGQGSLLLGTYALLLLLGFFAPLLLSRMCVRLEVFRYRLVHHPPPTEKPGLIDLSVI